jgi:exodeoxyribonuclease-1
MLHEVEKIFKKWSPAIFLGWSNIGFDDEMIRKEFFRSIRYPYLTNASPNKRHDGLNIARAAYAIDNSVLKTEINAKGNAVMKLESLARNNGFEVTGAHSAIFDAELTIKVLSLIKKKQPKTWDAFLKTGNRDDTETIIKKENIITLNEYFYGKSHLYLCAPLHPNACIHPVYKFGQVVDLRVDVKPLLKLSISDLKVEIKKTPKFLRTIRSNKAPIILDASYGKQVEPYNTIDPKIIKERAELVKNNEKFSQNVLNAVKEIAEEKQQTATQEDITETLEVMNDCDFELNRSTLMFDFMEELEGFVDVGVLKALMQKSLLTARLKGYGRAQTIIEIGSLETELFYKKLGFKLIEEKECESYRELFGRNGLMLLSIEF